MRWYCQFIGCYSTVASLLRFDEPVHAPSPATVLEVGMLQFHFFAMSGAVLLP